MWAGIIFIGVVVVLILLVRVVNSGSLSGPRLRRGDSPPDSWGDPTGQGPRT
jgi:hypothetical protein